MKKIVVLIFLLCQISFSQSDIVAKTIAEIEIKQDTIMAVFNWVADNIKYDVARFNKAMRNPVSNVSGDYKSEEEFIAATIKQVIRTKKGVCQDYAMLFDAIVKELGYQSHVVVGYARSHDSKGQFVPHAWNAIKVGGKWKLFDPTWASGYVQNGKKFIKNYNQEWYDVLPSEMIKTHMPCDPMWQLLKSPIDYKTFDKQLEVNELEEDYDFDSIISQYLQKGRKAQVEAELERSNTLGKGNFIIEGWRKTLLLNIDFFAVDSQKDLYQKVKISSDNAVSLFNNYIAARNKQFKGKKWEISVAKQYLIDSKKETLTTIEMFQTITDNVDDKGIDEALKNFKNLLERIETEEVFLEGLEND